MIRTNDRYVCISRPRRFGKTITANMLCSYYDREKDSTGLFADLSIAGDRSYSLHLNKYNVIFLNIAELLSRRSVSEMIDQVEKLLLRDLDKTYPEFSNPALDLVNSLKEIYMETDVGFVIIIDEWDCIFRERRDNTAEQKEYLEFLRAFLKDQPYVSLAYMTGILPIKKYGSHSALSMFKEISMISPKNFDRYIGFTAEEVQSLCAQYDMDYNEMSRWYNGYSFPKAPSVFNPRSVVAALQSGIFENYWTQTETFEALKIYIDLNFNGLRESIVSLLAGEKMQIDTSNFTNDMVTFDGKDDVLSLLIHLGYLGYMKDSGEVFIPNKEINDEFVTAIKSAKWTEVLAAIKTSDELLKATWRMEADAVAGYINIAHEETSHLNYSDENALSYVVSLAYYSARDYYTITRGMPSGKGYADMIFLPRYNHSDKPAMVVELKWDQSARGAIQQIKEKKYFSALEGHAGRILLVGINYDKKTKEHACVIEKFDLQGE
jgi:hypothetical protein